MMIWSWIGALLVGLTLGLFGSGGSIMTVPVLVYLVGEPDKLAIAESLGIVTMISLIGVIPFAMKRLVDWRSVLFFGLPGMAGAYGGAYLSKFLPGAFQLVLFAGVMLLAAMMMVRRRTPLEGAVNARHAAWKIMLEGLVVGVLTGLVGVGGGFLIVPALVLLGGLPMHMAVGTSLAIIALKSLSGFYKYIDVLQDAGQSINWELVLLFGAIGIVGSLIGKKVSEHISQERLKKGFAGFLVVMGVFILWQNVGVLLGQDPAHAPLPAHHQSDDSTMLGLFRRSGSASPPSNQLTPDAFAAQRTDEAFVIDVRTLHEYAGGHLAEAEHIDVQAPDFRARVDALDRTKPYYLYCRSGNRSGRAAQIMREMGFEQVYNIGGFDDLARAGLDVSR